MKMQKNTGIQMKMNKLLILILFVSCTVNANKNLNLCETQSQNMNKYLPRQLDHLTVLNKTYCVISKGKLYFQLDHTILNPNALPKNIKKIAKKEALKTYCSREYKKALNYLTYDFYYLDQNARPLYSFSIGKKDC